MRYIVLTLILVATLTSKAQTLWNPLNGPFGGNVKDIERTVAGKLYIATEYGGYSSSDNGTTWDRISGITNFDVRDFEINPTTGRIYAVCGGSTFNYFYSDDGVSWSSSTIAGMDNATRIEVHPTNASILLVSNNASLFRSDNGGTTLVNVYTFPNIITDLSINSNGVVIVGCQDNSVFKGLSGGISWSPASQVSLDGSLTRTVRSLATFNNKFYALTTDNNLYKSDNGSAPWQTIISASFTESGLLQTGRINFNASGNLLLVIDDGFWICDDPSIAIPVWTRKGDVGSWRLNKVLAGANNDIFVTSSTHSVVKSADQGVNWEQAITGITSVAPQDILETADGRILVADDVGFYLSLDQGQSWQTNKNPPNNSLEDFRKLVELDDASILMLSENGARKYEGSDVLTNVGGTPEWLSYFAFSKTTTPGLNIIIGASGQNIYRSMDDAVSWTTETYAGLPGTFSVEQFEFEDQRNYGDAGYLFIRLYDGGNQLYRVKQGTNNAELLTIPGGYLMDIKVLHTKDSDLLYILLQNGLNYSVSYSSDHGDSWTTVSPSILTGSHAQSLSVVTNTEVEYKDENMLSVFAEGGKIYISYDNGITWTTETYAAPRALFKKIITINNNYGYMIGQGVRARKSSRPLFVPRPPGNFKVASFTFNRATFTWADNSSLEEVYVLEKSIGNNTNYQVETEAGTNSTSILLTNLLPNTTYFFRLYAKGLGGNSPKTTEVSFTTLDNSCPLSIPENRSWTSLVQRTRGPQFATLSPATHINPDQQYTLTFDATGTELEGAAKVYAHAGVILVDADNPVSGDPQAPWQNTVGNWADDGIGEMANQGGNIWQLTLGPTLRNYFSVAGGVDIYWLGLVFRNADGSLVATNDGVNQDMFISIQKGYIDAAVGIDLSDASTKRYQMTAAPFQFFESCNVVSTLNPGTGSWVTGSNTLTFNWQEEDSSESGYITYFQNTSIINSTDPSPPTVPTLETYPFGVKKNLLRWNKVEYSSSYKIQRGVGTYTCPSDIGGTGISYVTTNMDAPGVPVFDPGPISGTVDFVEVSPGVYNITDYTFGMYQQVGYGMPSPSSSFRLTHNCSYLTALGGDFGETSWTYEIVNVTPTELTINWLSNFSEGATTVLTRSDGKSWLTQLSQDFTLPEIAEVSYPDLAYFDTDPSLVEGETYTYRISAVNSSGQSKYSVQSVVTNVDPLFEPQISELNKVTFDGQGITIADLDGDGYDDLIMSTFTNQFQEEVVPLIYKNNQDGSFTKITVPGMETENVSLYRGCIASDFNNDGLLDLLFTRTNADVDNAVLKDIVLLNQGNFEFTKTKIVTKPGYANQFSAHVALDITNDSKLDLLAVGNLGGGLDPQPSFLLEGNGDGTFTELQNVGTLTTDFINGIDASTADYDNDGDLDLMVLDRSTNVPIRLYKNNGDKTFSRVNGLEFDVYASSRWRTSSWGDIDNDGDLDLFVATQFGGLSGARQLYKNNGDGTFSIQIASAVTEKDLSCYGSAFGDIDNDGDLDLVVISQDVGGTKIFLNNGDGTFVKYGSVEAINSNYQGNIGVAFGDFDNDGFLDLVPGKNLGLPLTVFKNTAKGVSGNKWIKFKLNGTTSNKSAIGARIKVTTGAKSQIREISSRTGYGSQSSLMAHFGLGSASVVDQVEIRWPSGNVQTLTNLQGNKAYAIDEDLVGPTLSTVSPAIGAVGVALDSKLEITFNEVPVGISGKKLKVFKSSDLVTPVFVLDASTATVAGNTLSFTLPASLELFTAYTVIMDAGAVTDPFQNVSVDLLTSGTWTFTTLDNIPPAIAFTEVPLLDKGFGSTVFAPTVTDNAAVASVTMTYRGVTSKTTSDLVGVKNGDTWEFTVAETLFDAMGLEYFFTAKDADNNKSRSPEDNTVFHKTRLNFPVGFEPTISLIGSNGNVTGYKIISIPYELSNNGINENFEELGGADPKKFRFIRYHETQSPGWDEYPGALNTFAIGEGYFINVRNATTITIKESKVPDFSQSNLFVMNLKKGWNQIGNPYTTQIAWSDVLSYNGNPTGVSNVSKFNGQYFVDPAGAIDPFEGGFVQVENDITLKIPFKGFTSGGRVRNQIENHDISKPSWVVPLTLNQQDLIYSLGSIGMDPAAKITKDDFDLIIPPRLSEYLDMYSDHPEHFMGRFTRDVVPTTDMFEWEFTVASNLQGLTNLTWDRQSLGTGNKDLYLFDEGLQKMVNMKEVTSHTFDPAVGNKFRIYYGENLSESIKPTQVGLGEPYPNPSSRLSNINYTLPPSSSYHVKLEVYDMMGRPLHVIEEAIKEPGFYTEHWDSGSNSSGFYIYRLTVESNGNRQILMKKLLLNK